MPQVKNESKPSDLIACPICGKLVRRRGLLSHIRLAHPEVDAKSVVRKYIMPTVKGRTLFQAVELPSGEIQFNWLSLNREEVHTILQGLKALEIFDEMPPDIKPLSFQMEKSTRKNVRVPKNVNEHDELVDKMRHAKAQAKIKKKPGELGFFDW